MEYVVKILMNEFVTHNVRRFIIEKPENFKFIPGQATELSINKPELKNEKRPFTFTSLNEDLVLEFTIKIYSDHDGVTNKLRNLKPGDELILREPWGTINYKEKGTFIAGGAGITPFIAIFRQLQKENKLKGNKLIFSNKTSKDIILEKELKEMFSQEDLILTLTQESKQDYENKLIDLEFLKNKIKDLNQNFYICGPALFVKNIKESLEKIGAAEEVLVIEE